MTKKFMFIYLLKFSTVTFGSLQYSNARVPAHSNAPICRITNEKCISFPQPEIEFRAASLN